MLKGVVSFERPPLDYWRVCIWGCYSENTCHCNPTPRKLANVTELVLQSKATFNALS